MPCGAPACSITHRQVANLAAARLRGKEGGRREEGGRTEGGRREEGGRKEGGRREEGGRKEGGRREEGGRKEGGGARWELHCKPTQGLTALGLEKLNIFNRKSVVINLAVAVIESCAMWKEGCEPAKAANFFRKCDSSSSCLLHIMNAADRGKCTERQ
jgi:hypothetical protein